METLIGRNERMKEGGRGREGDKDMTDREKRQKMYSNNNNSNNNNNNNVGKKNYIVTKEH